MARKTSFNSEYILSKTSDFVKEYGVDAMNARDLCKYIGCSTQPLFRLYSNTDELKKDLKKYLHDDYDNFIAQYIDKEDYMFTISYAYALYAKEMPNIFKTLFFTEIAGTRTIDEVVNSSWNRETIECMTKQYNISLKEAEKIYIDVRFFTHGLATQICAKSISVTNEEINRLIRHMLNLCVDEVKRK